MNFRQLWFRDKLAVEIKNIQDLAKFNRLHRELLQYCNLNIKKTYILEPTQKKLRSVRGPIYIMLYGVFSKEFMDSLDSFSKNSDKYVTLDINEFENIFRSDLLIAKMEKLLNEIEDNEEKSD